MKDSQTSSSTAEITMLGLLVAMFLGSALCWSAAPESIPVHWNLNGEVDRWGGKFEGLMLLPLITFGIYALLKYIPVLDPKKENYAQFANVYSIIRLGTLLVMAAIHAAIIAWVLGYKSDMSMIVALLVGGLMMLLGNFMGKIRPNWFVGIRTPWTFSSKKSWVKTHRMGGWVFILMGITIVATGLFKSQYALFTMLGVVLVGSLWTVVYSYLVWRGDTNRVPAMDSSPAEDNAD